MRLEAEELGTCGGSFGVVHTRQVDGATYRTPASARPSRQLAGARYSTC
jgi:hypothetical protein